MNITDNKHNQILKKLDPLVKKELLRLKKEASKSITNQRVYEAYRDINFEPYIINPNSYTNFAPTLNQHKILKNTLNKLKLTHPTKKIIYDRTIQFFIDFRYEYHDRINFRKEFIQSRGENDLKNNFEKEIDAVLSRYKKEHYTTDFFYELTEFQNKVMKLFQEHFSVDSLESSLREELIKSFPAAKDWDRNLIERYAPSNRPNYECYPPYLYDLSNFIQEETPYYMPILVEFLTSLQTTKFDIFDSFVINKISLRALISKYRRGMNKGV